MPLLYIRNAADDGWILVSGSEGNKIYDADGDTKIQVEESADEDIIRFDTAGTERMVIDEGGLVGIGNNNPDAQLQVGSAPYYAAKSNKFTIRENAGAVYAAYIDQDNTGGYGLLIRTDGTDEADPALNIVYGKDADDQNIANRLLHVAASGEITTPKNPACQVRATGMSNLAINTTHTVDFDTEEVDRGSDFDSGTNTFTCPVDGLYYVNFQLYLNDIDITTTWLYLYVYATNYSRYKARTFKYHMSADQDDCFGMTAMIDCDASDTIYCAVGVHNSGIAQTDVLNNIGSYLDIFLIG